MCKELPNDGSERSSFAGLRRGRLGREIAATAETMNTPPTSWIGVSTSSSSTAARIAVEIGSIVDDIDATVGVTGCTAMMNSSAAVPEARPITAVYQGIPDASGSLSRTSTIGARRGCERPASTVAVQRHGDWPASLHTLGGPPISPPRSLPSLELASSSTKLPAGQGRRPSDLSTAMRADRVADRWPSLHGSVFHSPEAPPRICRNSSTDGHTVEGAGAP